MFPIVTAIQPNLDAGAVRSEASMSSGAIDQQIHEAERKLELLRRNLSQAQARARQQEEKLAEARRRMEQWRWVNAINEGDPEVARQAAISLATQTQLVDVAIKSNADVAAQIERLQNRIDRQIARYFDLQSRRRAGGDERRDDNIATTRPQTPPDRLAGQGLFDESPDNAGTDGGFPRQRRMEMNYPGYLMKGDGV